MQERAPDRVLIIEDDESTVMLVEASLAASGADVHSHGCVTGAMEKIAEVNPDIILLDVVFDDGSGIDLCKEIRSSEQFHNLPIVMSTGLSDFESVNKAFHAGATDFLTKPLNLQLLRYRIDYVLRGSRTSMALRQSEQGLATAERIAGMGYWQTSLDTGATIRSDGIVRLFGENIPNPINETLQFFKFISPESHNELRHALRVARMQAAPINLNVTMLPTGGQLGRTFQLTLEKTTDETDATCLVCTALDITRVTRVEERADFLAHHDLDTGLLNRKQTVLTADSIASSYATRLAVVAIGLDDMSLLNKATRDSGKASLSQLLTSRLVSWMSDYLHESDWGPYDDGTVDENSLVGSLGPGRFLLICPLLGRLAELDASIRTLLRSAGEIRRGDDIDSYLNIQAGIALTPNDGTDGAVLIERAEIALNDAIARKNYDVEYFREYMGLRSSHQFALDSDIRLAIENNELFFVYQPRIDINSGQVLSVEALVRWQHASRGVVPPREFIWHVEHGKLASLFSEWIFTTAARDIQWMKSKGMRDVRVALNISATLLQDRRGIEHFLATLEESGLSANEFEFELTERVLLEDRIQAIHILTQLRDRGVEISIDDFGTDYSSLSYLRDLPVDALKIDRTFIRGLSEEERDNAMVRAITGIARIFGLKVIAEGVETEAQVDALKQIGCDMCQGFYYAHPMPIEELIQFVRRSNGDSTSELHKSSALLTHTMMA